MKQLSVEGLKTSGFFSGLMSISLDRDRTFLSVNIKSHLPLWMDSNGIKNVKKKNNYKIMEIRKVMMKEVEIWSDGTRVAQA